jgi:hypothetical protein
MKGLRRANVVVFTGLCSVLLLTMLACQNSEASSGISSTIDSKTSAAIEKYSVIGTKHNEKLAGYYGDAASSKIQSSKSTVDFNTYFGITDASKSITIPIYSSTAKGLTPTSIVDTLGSSNVTTTTENYYLKKMETVLYSSTTIDQVQEGIIKIEAEAVNNLSGSSLDVVMGYAETAKASASYWSKNSALLADLSKNLNLRSVSRGWSWGLAFLVAAADAAGASAGIAAGELFVIAACAVATPAVGAALQAANIPTYCGIYCGACSSAMTYQNGAFTISIDISSIIAHYKS